MRGSIERKGVLGLLTALLSVGIIVAQANCPELVQDALLAVDENCNSAGRNEACYGYDQVEASFLVSVEDDYFTQPANIAAIADVETIRTAPLNTETGVWGVAIMNIQADLPNTIPGQSVTFVLLGDVEVENAVAPEDAFVPSEGIEVTINTAAGANVRSGPGTTYNVVGGLQNGEIVLADGLSEDGEWLRVAYRERPAWLSMSVINDNDPALRELPTLSADLQTPMQAFYLRTGMGEPECEESPDDILLVQGPENIEISINVNGANIRLGSTGALRIIQIGDLFYLEIVVIDGTFEVDGQIITQGYRSILCLGDEDSRGLDGENNDLVVTCGASEPERVDPEEFGEEWCILEDVPANILNYGLEVLCPGETPPPPSNTAGGGGSDSQIAGVDCSSFNILTADVPATSFLLSWSPATGADSYDVAVYDSGGFQTSIYTGITENSIGLNGGVGFASAGYIDVRAFLGGQYACYSRLNFNRSADPNENTLPEESAVLTARLQCNYSRIYVATISYTGGNGNTITATGDTGAAIISDSSSANRGTLVLNGGVGGIRSIMVTSSSGESISLGSCP